MSIKRTNTNTASANMGAVLSAHDAEIRSLHKEVSAVGQGLDSLRTDVNRGLSHINDKLSDASKPAYGTMAAWASAVIGIIAFCSSGYVRSIDANTDANKSQQMILMEQQYKLGEVEGQIKTLTELNKNGTAH